MLPGSFVKLSVSPMTFANKITDLTKRIEHFYIDAERGAKMVPIAPIPVKVQLPFTIRRRCNKGKCKTPSFWEGVSV